LQPRVESWLIVEQLTPELQAISVSISSSPLLGGEFRRAELRLEIDRKAPAEKTQAAFAMPTVILQRP
jgi:hypothetical protein